MRPHPVDPLGRLKSVNPFMRVVYGVLGLGVMGVMLTLGAMFFVVFAAIALIGGSVLAARIWWLSRKAERVLGDQFEPFRPQGPGPEQNSGPPRGKKTSVLEGEFVVVERHEEDQR